MAQADRDQVRSYENKLSLAWCGAVSETRRSMRISVAAVPARDVSRPLSPPGYQADAPAPQSLACITQPRADSVLL